MTTDRELADEIERRLPSHAFVGAKLGLVDEQWQQIIAALRRSQPEGEMGYEEYHDGIIGVFKMNADGSRNLKVLTPQASEQFRAMLSVCEAEGRKP
jgi:hypothetical protein